MDPAAGMGQRPPCGLADGQARASCPSGTTPRTCARRRPRQIHASCSGSPGETTAQALPLDPPAARASRPVAGHAHVRDAAPAPPACATRTRVVRHPLPPRRGRPWAARPARPRRAFAGQQVAASCRRRGPARPLPTLPGCRRVGAPRTSRCSARCAPRRLTCWRRPAPDETTSASRRPAPARAWSGWCRRRQRHATRCVAPRREL